MVDELEMTRLRCEASRFRWGVFGGIAVLLFMFFVTPAACVCADAECARQYEIQLYRRATQPAGCTRSDERPPLPWETPQLGAQKENDQ